MAARWYIVQAYSNFEHRVKESLEREAAEKGLDHLFEEILVPTEDVVEIRKGRKVESKRKFFPGYAPPKLKTKRTIFAKAQSTKKKKIPIKTTIIITRTVVVSVSRHVGQTTLRASWRTCPTYLTGPTFGAASDAPLALAAAAVTAAFAADLPFLGFLVLLLGI